MYCISLPYFHPSIDQNWQRTPVSRDLQIWNVKFYPTLSTRTAQTLQRVTQPLWPLKNSKILNSFHQSDRLTWGKFTGRSTVILFHFLCLETDFFDVHINVRKPKGVNKYLRWSLESLNWSVGFVFHLSDLSIWRRTLPCQTESPFISLNWRRELGLLSICGRGHCNNITSEREYILEK